jgi:hypothetical protein
MVPPMAGPMVYLINNYIKSACQTQSHQLCRSGDRTGGISISSATTGPDRQYFFECPYSYFQSNNYIVSLAATTYARQAIDP